MKLKLLLILSVYLLSFVTGCASTAGQRFINNPAPVTLLTMEDGSTRSLSQYEGKPVVLFFWSTWCKHSNPILNRLNKFAATHQEVPVIAVSIDTLELENDVKERMKRYPHLQSVFSGNDVSDIAYVSWEGDSLPYIAVIEGDGRVAAVGDTDDIVYKYFKVPSPQE